MSPTSVTCDALLRDTTSAADSLAATMNKEQQSHFVIARSCSIYLNDNDNITPDDRMKMVDWAYSIVDTCKFDRTTVSMAMEMVNRFLSKPSNLTQIFLSDQKQYQLLTIAALYISIKITETVAFGSDLFASVSNDMYSAEEIESTELLILRGLGWRVNAPSSVLIAFDLLSLVLPKVALAEKALSFLLDEVRFQTEYAVRDHYFSMQRPSTVAVAAIFNALDYLERDTCREVLTVLMSETGDKFDCLHQVFEVKNRLRCLIERDDTAEEDILPCPGSSEILEEETSVCDDITAHCHQFHKIRLHELTQGDKNSPLPEPQSLLIGPQAG